jgi:DNA-directed RNA polymerase subunit RPC12/RpoP
VVFCPWCGQRLIPFTCARCGTELSSEWRHCITCGAEVKDPFRYA